MTDQLDQEMTIPEEPVSDIAAPAACNEQVDIRRQNISALGGAVLYLGFFIAMTVVNLYPPKLPPLWWALLAPLTTVAYLLILVYTIRLLCRLTLSAGQETLLMTIALFGFLALNPMVRDIAWRLLSGDSWEKIFASLTTPDTLPILQVLVPFLLILTGIFFGQLLARIIHERALLVPVGLVAGLIDFWGVYWGPVGMMSAAAPAAMSALGSATTAAAAIPDDVKTQLPQQLLMFGNIAPPQEIGLGDFVFLAFFLTCAYRLGFSARRTMWGIFAGLLLASLIMALDGQTLFGHEISIAYLPGLLFICGGLLVANLREWRLSRREWGMTGILVGVLVAGISASIAVAELGKPRVSELTYHLDQRAPREVVAQALAHIRDAKHAPTELVLLYGNFDFERVDNTMQLRGWRLVVLGREHHATLRSTCEYAISTQSIAGQPGWQVTEHSRQPAEEALGMLSPGNGDLTTRIAQERGLPARALGLLDQVNTHARAEKGKFFRLILTPDRAILGNLERRALVKEFKFGAKPVTKNNPRAIQ